MNMIFAKHDARDKEFIFSVPAGAVVKKGDMLWVNTMYGKSIAIASSDMFFGDEEIAVRYGAYLPVKEVAGIISKELYSAIVKRALTKCLNDFEVESDTLPF